LTGLVASPDGTFLLKRRLTGSMLDAAAIGTTLGAELKKDAPPSIFELH
jgi:hydroxymethylbilane synthase